MALFPGLPRWAGTRKVKPIWILLKQETVSGSGISWAICKSAPRSRQITMPAPHLSVFYRPDALHAAQPTASKHWRHNYNSNSISNTNNSISNTNNTTTMFMLLSSWPVIARIHPVHLMNVQGGPKKQTVLRVDNFVTVSGKKVCYMSKVSKLCLEKCIKLGC